MIKVVKESGLNERMPEALTNGRYYLFCPGCYEQSKAANLDEGEGCWLLASLHCFSANIHSFNGDMEKPTLSPSLLVSWSDRTQYCCHSYVQDGTIRFLDDCTHGMKGQTVELMDAQPYMDHFHSK